MPRNFRIFPFTRLGVLVAAVAASWSLVPSSAPRGMEARAEAPPVIVGGTFLHAANEPNEPASGVSAWLYLPPPAGVHLRPLLIAYGRTDPAGRLVLSSPNSEAFQKFGSGNDGWLNLDLLVGDARIYMYRSVPRKFIGGHWIGPEDSDGSLELPGLVLAKGEPGVGPTTGNIRRFPRVIQSLSSSVACSETTPALLRSETVQTPVGELHAWNAPATFTYGPTASSTIDAVESWGSAGPWSLAGVTNVATPNPHAAVVQSTPNYNRRLNSYFVYQEFRSFNMCFGYRYTIKAKVWPKSVLIDGGPASDPSRHCTVARYSNALHKAAYSASFTRNSNPALKYLASVNLAVPFRAPISVGAVSGYSSSVTARWSFSVGGVLCGDTGKPSTSKRVFAGS